ncbi:MAG: hypothetical protein LUQ01_02760 [Methanolinea sp.]|nr:hypothetical protein [Methanolinea sp.]
MSTLLPPTMSLATGVGALPHTDPAKACDDVLAVYPRVPYIPTLPARGLLESIVFSDSSRLPGGIVKEERLLVDRSRDLSSEMEQVYLDYMEQRTGPYALTGEYASGFPEMMQRDMSGSILLKCQVTGPVTFGMQVVDPQKRPIYYDEQFADLLPKMLALRARWCEQAMRSIRGVTSTLVVMNEPYLAALGSSVIPISRDSVIAGWNDISSLVDGGLGIHCCSNTDWEFVLSLEPSVLSFDAYTGSREFLLYTDAVAGYLEKGGVVAWGIVPADHRIFSGETKEALLRRYLEIRGRLTDVVEEGVFDSQSLITPTCGIRFADEAGAREIMEASAWISGRVREGFPP